MVTVYKRADGQHNRKMTNDEVIAASAFDYNPAVEARYTTEGEAAKARSRKDAVDYALGDTQRKITARM